MNNNTRVTEWGNYPQKYTSSALQSAQQGTQYSQQVLNENAMQDQPINAAVTNFNQSSNTPQQPFGQDQQQVHFSQKQNTQHPSISLDRLAGPDSRQMQDSITSQPQSQQTVEQKSPDMQSQTSKIYQNMTTNQQTLHAQYHPQGGEQQKNDNNNNDENNIEEIIETFQANQHLGTHPVDDLVTYSKSQRDHFDLIMQQPQGAVIPIIKFHFGPYNPQHELTPGHERQELLILSRQAEMSERFGDLAQFTRLLVYYTGGKLSREERTLFYIAHFKLLMPMRHAIKMLTQNFQSDLTHNLALDYSRYIQYELKTYCLSLIDFICAMLLQAHLTLPDHLVFFHKMVGDLYKYIAELNPLAITKRPHSQTPNADGRPIHQSKQNHYLYLCRYFYHQGAKIAETHLPINSPIRLGLLLGYAVAAFELFRDHKAACEMVKMTFDRAITKLDELDEEDYRDATLILQLMRDNLQLWISMQHASAPLSITLPPGFEAGQLTAKLGKPNAQLTSAIGPSFPQQQQGQGQQQQTQQQRQ